MTSAPRKMTGCWNTGGLRREAGACEACAPEERHLCGKGTEVVFLEKTSCFLVAHTETLAGKATRGLSSASKERTWCGGRGAREAETRRVGRARLRRPGSGRLLLLCAGMFHLHQKC